MDVSVGGALRWCRALLLGAVAMSAGVLAHRSANGLMPGRTALVVLLVACVAGSAIFLGRPASRLRVVMLLVAGQTFIHAALTALAGHRGDPPLVRPVAPTPTPALQVPSGNGRRVGSLMDQAYAGQPGGQHVQLTVPYPVQHLIADMTGAHALMAVEHLGAAVIVGLWLATGERALWAVLTLTPDLAARLLQPTLDRCLAAAATVHLLATTLNDAGCRRSPVAAVPLRPRERPMSRNLVRRGPPTLATA